MCEDMEFLKMLKRMIRAGAKRVSDADELELREFAALRKFFDEKLTDAIHNQIRNGKSWTDIGRALGVTKQAAYKKYSGGK